MSDLQKIWRSSMASINHPVAARAYLLELEGIRRDRKGQIFDLKGILSARDAKRLAVHLFVGLGIPVTVIIRDRIGSPPYRAYCDAGTAFNREGAIGGEQK